MNVNKEPTKSQDLAYTKRMLSITEASVYLGLGRSTALVFLEEIGAKRKIGKRALYDKVVIDNYLESEQKGGNYNARKKANHSFTASRSAHN